MSGVQSLNASWCRLGEIAFSCVASIASPSLAEEPLGTTMEPPTGPAAAEASERKAHALARELHAIAEKHGPGAVALQASLLIETIRAGAVGPSEVRVVGASPRHGGEYLEIDVGTGLIFDSDTTDIPACTDRVWATVVAPVLGKMETFAHQPAGLDLVLVYGRQHFSSHIEREADLSAPQEARTARFVIPAKALDDLAYDRISIDELKAATTTQLD